MHWLLLLVSFLFVLAAAAVAPPEAAETPQSTAPTKAQPDESNAHPNESKSKAQASAAEIGKASEHDFNRCMNSWDAATHMTKKEWARTCRRTR
jgi:hypothetical protein